MKDRAHKHPKFKSHDYRRSSTSIPLQLAVSLPPPSALACLFDTSPRSRSITSDIAILDSKDIDSISLSRVGGITSRPRLIVQRAIYRHKLELKQALNGTDVFQDLHWPKGTPFFSKI